MKKLFLVIMIFVASPLAASAQMMLFVGDGCSHCEKVEDFIAEHNLESTLDIESYEIYNNQDNLALYLKTSNELGYENGAVPLLVDGQTFLDGADPIISYLSGRDAGSISPTKLNQEDSQMLNQIIAQSYAVESPPVQSSSLPYVITAIILLFFAVLIYKYRR